MAMACRASCILRVGGIRICMVTLKQYRSSHVFDVFLFVKVYGMFEKLMMKIYEFFYSAKLFGHPV